MSTKTKMVKFNIKNLKYALEDGSGGYETIKELAYASAIALEAEYSETKIFGDGEIIGTIGTDKGKSGGLTVINIEDHYELDTGRSMMTDAGIADIQQRKSVRHAIYYEVEAMVDGVMQTIKNWLFGCTTGKAGESYEQTEDEPTINPYEYPLTVLGVILLDTAGTDPYTDDDGNTYRVTRATKYPGDTGYATFQNAVPLPKSRLCRIVMNDGEFAELPTGFTAVEDEVRFLWGVAPHTIMQWRDVYVDEGSPLETPPTLDGHDFDDYYADEDLTVPVDTDAMIPTIPTIYAKFTESAE